MKADRSIAIGMLAALALGVGSSHAAPDHDAASAAPSASAAPRAADDAPGLDVDPPAADKSPVPKADGWAKASPVRLARVRGAGATCRAVRVLEWLRIRCATKTFAVSLLGGSNVGLAFWIGPDADGQPGEVQFPVRRGDRRVVQFWAAGKDVDGGFQAKPLLVVQEQWVEGEPAPIVTAM